MGQCRDNMDTHGSHPILNCVMVKIKRSDKYDVFIPRADLETNFRKTGIIILTTKIKNTRNTHFLILRKEIKSECYWG